jgi:hypothetical protein
MIANDCIVAGNIGTERIIFREKSARHNSASPEKLSGTLVSLLFENRISLVLRGNLGQLEI